MREDWLVLEGLRGGLRGQVGVKAPVALPGLIKNLDSNSKASNLFGLSQRCVE